MVDQVQTLVDYIKRDDEAKHNGFNSLSDMQLARAGNLTPSDMHKLDVWAQHLTVDPSKAGPGGRVTGFRDMGDFAQSLGWTSDTVRYVECNFAKPDHKAFASLASLQHAGPLANVGIYDKGAPLNFIAVNYGNAPDIHALTASISDQTQPPPPPKPPAPAVADTNIGKLQQAAGFDANHQTGKWDADTNNAIKHLIEKGQTTDVYQKYGKEHPGIVVDGVYGEGTQKGLEVLLKSGQLNDQEKATFAALKEMSNDPRVVNQQLQKAGYKPPADHATAQKETDLVAQEKPTVAAASAAVTPDHAKILAAAGVNPAQEKALDAWVAAQSQGKVKDLDGLAKSWGADNIAGNIMVDDKPVSFTQYLVSNTRINGQAPADISALTTVVGAGVKVGIPASPQEVKAQAQEAELLKATGLTPDQKKALDGWAAGQSHGAIKDMDSLAGLYGAQGITGTVPVSGNKTMPFLQYIAENTNIGTNKWNTIQGMADAVANGAKPPLPLNSREKAIYQAGIADGSKAQVVAEHNAAELANVGLTPEQKVVLDKWAKDLGARQHITLPGGQPINNLDDLAKSRGADSIAGRVNHGHGVTFMQEMALYTDAPILNNTGTASLQNVSMGSIPTASSGRRGYMSLSKQTQASVIHNIAFEEAQKGRNGVPPNLHVDAQIQQANGHKLHVRDSFSQLPNGTITVTETTKQHWYSKSHTSTVTMDVNGHVSVARDGIPVSPQSNTTPPASKQPATGGQQKGQTLLASRQGF